MWKSVKCHSERITKKSKENAPVSNTKSSHMDHHIFQPMHVKYLCKS